MQLDLIDEEAAALLSLLNRAIDNDRYPPSQHIRMLRSIPARFLIAAREPLPARPPDARRTQLRARAPCSGRPPRLGACSALNDE
jgi:hypothetical protein